MKIYVENPPYDEYISEKNARREQYKYLPAQNNITAFIKCALQPVDLQLFAEDGKTEKATPKKRQDARKKGQVLQSREITSTLLLLFIFVGIKFSGGFIYSELRFFFRNVLTEYFKVEDLFSTEALSKLFVESLLVILKTTAPVFAIAVIISLVTGYAQVGFLFTTETLGMKFSKLNPLQGLKRIFSLRSLTELLKSIFKIAVIVAVVYFYIKDEAVNITNLVDMDIISIAAYIASAALDVAIRICIAMIFISILDYGYQWWEYEKSLKMTKQEVKEEYKQTEGNPEVKSKIKQKQRQLSMKRMLHEVPKADVVITNPTHFAVAVRYEPEKSQAPMVIAKGQDYVAQRIKEVARENGVEVVENKPLARSLYETVDVGQAIPPELYQAVAEILAFVYNLKGINKVG